MLSRGNYAFDLFLQLTHVMQVYLFSVLCMFSTCHPSSYDEESRRRLERFNQQFKSLFGEVDLKKELMSDGVNVLQMEAGQLDLFQEMGEFRQENMKLKETVTIISNYVDMHLQEEEETFEFDDERFISSEEQRAIEAERKLKDTFAHAQLRKFLPGSVTCLDTMKPTQLRKVTLVALEQVHFVFESLLMLKPHMKPIMNNQ